MGAFEILNPVTGVDGTETLPTHLWMGSNSPNPFNPTTKIQYSLPASGRVSLKIYDVSGRLVRQLVHGEHQDEGLHTVTWDGRSSRGATVSSGAYFCRIEFDDRVLTKKMMLVK